jgi:hypothetical protein
VLSAIEFHNQPAFLAKEIDNERTKRVLSTKLCTTELTRTQARPESAFRIGLVAA